MSLAGKKILIAVTGGIAGYKVCEIIRDLKKSGALVRVMMTTDATHFITPLTFETLSENPVLTSLFPETGWGSTVHIEWARWPDLILICPATANSIAKIACGLADNAVTTTILASTARKLFCPAMNKEMYANPIYQSNQSRLMEWGFQMVAPGVGSLACGEEGWGRLANKEEILYQIQSVLTEEKDLTGYKILITAGPTEEPLDPVRFISNHSSGKMGYAIAERAELRGASITLVSGPSGLQTRGAVRVIKVVTAQEMFDAVKEHLPESNIFISAAAVSDYRPAAFSPTKIKKSAQDSNLRLLKNPDILEWAATQKQNLILVGFSVETDREIENSIQKLHHKKLDLIVVNNPLEPGAGFQIDTNRVTVIDDQGRCDEWPIMTKIEVADRLLTRVKLLRQTRS